MPASPRPAQVRRAAVEPDSARSRLRPCSSGRCSRRQGPLPVAASHTPRLVRDDRGRHPVRARLRRRLGAALRGDAPHLRRSRRRLAGHLRRPRRQLGVQGRAQRRLGRELRSARRRRRQHPTHDLGVGATVKFYYDHKSHWVDRQRRSVIAVAPGSFQSELGCPGDWQPGLPPLVAPGRRRRRGLHLRDDRAARRQLRDEGRHQRVVGRELRPGRRAGRREHRFHGPGEQRQGDLPLRRLDPHPDGQLAGHGHDNNVEWDGLRHDSRVDVYRTPGGAVPAGTPVTLRFRTFHDDVTAVRRASTASNAAAQQVVPMSIAASGRRRATRPALEAETCDFWQLTMPASIADEPDNLWYRFIVTDGTDTDYYADDTPALDGGLGAATDDPVDQSWALMQYVPGFTAPKWAKDAVIYQIFPDRFRNGDTKNDPQDRRPPLRRSGPEARLGRQAGGLLPELRGRRRQLPVAVRYDAARLQPDEGVAARPRLLRRRPQGRRPGARRTSRRSASRRSTSTRSSTRGSNHGYDTQDYTEGRSLLRDTEGLRQPHQARQGARDPGDPRRRLQPHVVGQPAVRPLSPLLDGRAPASRRRRRIARGSPSTTSRRAPARACRRRAGRLRDLRRLVRVRLDPRPDQDAGRGPGVLPDRPRTASRSTGSRPARRGWRLDVSGDPSFPNGYWESFRTVVKKADPQALTISRDLAEGLDAAPDAPRRPARHDDELPAPRRGPRPARARELRPEGLRRQRPPDQRLASSPTGSPRLREDYRTPPTTR